MVLYLAREVIKAEGLAGRVNANTGDGRKLRHLVNEIEAASGAEAGDGFSNVKKGLIERKLPWCCTLRVRRCLARAAWRTALSHRGLSRRATTNSYMLACHIEYDCRESRCNQAASSADSSESKRLQQGG